MGTRSRRKNAAAVNLGVSTLRRDTISKNTATASRINCNEAHEMLMMAMELGESGWLLGFASEYGQKSLRRKIATRDGKPCSPRSRGRSSGWDLRPIPEGALLESDLRLH